MSVPDYRFISHPPLRPAAACGKREEWFAAAVRRLQHALQPARTSFEVVSRGKNSWLRVFHQGEKVSIRVGQMVAQRRWGVHYWSRNSAIDLEIAHSTIQGALNRFQSDAASINRFHDHTTFSSAHHSVISAKKRSQFGITWCRSIVGVIMQ